jgi:TatD-related deoxyribonuclease
VGGIAGLPVVDHHCHLSPAGEGVRAASRFRSAGGTHLFLATQSYEPKVPSELEDYVRQFETTERLGRAVKDGAGVEVWLVVAPYPVDLVRAASTLGVAAALELHDRALDLAGRWVREGRAVAIGEVGWPHFPVPPDVGAACRSAFLHALEVARDVGCPAVVHSPDLDAAGWSQLDRDASAAGLPAYRLVKHYARARRSAPDGDRTVPSYLARRDLVNEVAADPGPWFLETDFLDDPARPGAVLDLATVPRRAASLARASPAAGERLAVPFVRSVERVYGFTPELPRGGP